MAMWQAQRRGGASARRRYREMRRAWRRRARRIFVTLWILTATVLIMSVVISKIWPSWAYWSGFLTGCVMALTVALHQSPPGWVENWQVGAWGEEWTAKEVAKLAAAGWVMLHDLRRIGGGNVDHVLVGPGGVFVLDSKNLDGEVRVDRDVMSLTRPGDERPAYSSDQPARQARGNAAHIHDLIKRRTGRTLWVRGVVVLWATFPKQHARGNKVDLVAGSHLADWLTAQPTQLTPADVDELAAALLPRRHRRRAAA
jgi:Nuclease-related domain